MYRYLISKNTNTINKTPLKNILKSVTGANIVVGNKFSSTYSKNEQNPLDVNYNETFPPLFKNKDVLGGYQFDKNSIQHFIDTALHMKAMNEHSRDARLRLLDYDKGRVLLNVFMEPSTRTSSSFQTAMTKLGGSIINLNSDTSSAKKGETLTDTIKTIENYADVIVLRHPEVGAAKEAASVTDLPVINAGDGQGEHPTQSLLDTVCIYDQFKHLDNLTITMVGDLKYGRTVHSLANILTNFNIKINFVSSPTLAIPEKVTNTLKEKNTEFNDYQDLNHLKTVLPETDVLYMTRVQQERFSTREEYLKEKGLYVVGPQMLDDFGAKKTLKVMHPLPRVDEMLPELDNDPRACYFQQVRYGLYTRMAILHEVLRDD